MKVINKLKIKILTAAAVFMVLSGATEVAAQGMSIYELQSLFLYNFTKHVKWADQSTGFTVGIYGNLGAYNAIKDNLETKTVWGEKVNVILIASPEDVGKCNIAFMTKSNKKKIIDLVSSADLSNTLLVTEDDMIDEGAAISFIFEQANMKFKISKVKIEQSGLKVSSSLLSMGISV